VLFLCGLSTAQEAAPAVEAAPAAGDSAPAIDEEDIQRTPRETIAAFMEAMEGVRLGYEERLAAALSCLYLGDLAEENRLAEGERLANELYDVLDRLVFEIEEIPEEVDGRNVAVSIGEGEGSVELALRRYDDGYWRVSFSQTLQKLDEIGEQVETAVEVDEESGWDPRFASPRDAVRTFLRGVLAWRDEEALADAIEALNMPDVESDVIRADAGRELAFQLMMVLNRTVYIRPHEIPNDPDLTRFRFVETPIEDIELEPVEDPDTGLSAWKFSDETVEAVPALYDFYRDMPVVEGVDEDLPALTSLRVRDWVRVYAPFLLRKDLLLENWQWLGLLLVVASGMAASRLVAFLIILSIRRIFRRQHMHLREKYETKFMRPIRIAFMAWVWLLGLGLLNLPPQVYELLFIIADVITSFAAVWAAYRLIDILGEYLAERAERTQHKFDDLLVPFVSRTLKAVVIVFGVVFIADTLDYDYKSLLAGLGIGGIAFALAAKDTVANIFGSLTILLDRPFQMGDWVRIGDVDGTVESVGMRSTRIRTFYNSLVSVPNSELLNATIDNMGERQYRRISTTLALTYDTPPEKIDAFCEGVREIICTHPYTRKDYYHVYFNEFGGSSLEVMLYCFLDTPDWATELRERHRLFVHIVHLARKLGVEFAFPTQTLYLRRDETPRHEEPGETPEVFGRQQARELLKEHLPPGVPPPVSFKNTPETPQGEDEQME
jgi:MscS family membrane protein